MAMHPMTALPVLLLLAIGCAPKAGEVGSVDDTEGDSGSGGSTSTGSGTSPATDPTEGSTTEGPEAASSSSTEGDTDPTDPSETTTGPSAVCGDEQLDDGEDCDDGNLDNEDGCNVDCVEGGALLWERTFVDAGVEEIAFGPTDSLWTLSSFGDLLIVLELSASGDPEEDVELEQLDLPADAGNPTTNLTLAPTEDGVFAGESRFWSSGATPGQQSRVSWVGETPWTLDLDGYVEHLAVRPGGGVLAASSDGTVEAFDASGTSLWTWSGTSIEDLEASPGGVLVVERNLLTLLAADGSESWSTPDPASDGRLFFRASARDEGGFDIFAAAQLPAPAPPAWVRVDARGAVVQDLAVPSIETVVVDFSSGGSIVWSPTDDEGAHIRKAGTNLEAAWSVPFNNAGAEIAVGSDGRVAAVGLIGGEHTLHVLTP